MRDEQGRVNQVIVGLREEQPTRYSWPRMARRMSSCTTARRPTRTASLGLLASRAGCRTSSAHPSAARTEVWYTERWAEQFALPPDLPNNATGWGDSSEQVAAFRVERATLFGYMEAAHRVARERVARLTPEELEQTVAWGTAETPLSPSPAWRVLIVLLNDSIQHTGQSTTSAGLSPNLTGVVGRKTPRERRTWEGFAASRESLDVRPGVRTWWLQHWLLEGARGRTAADRWHAIRRGMGKGSAHVARASRRPFPFRKQSEQVPNEVRLGSNGSSMLLAILGLSCPVVLLGTRVV